MTNDQPIKKSMSRRRFIQVGTTAAAGVLLSACGGNSPAEAPAVAQGEPVDTPIAPTATPSPTDTPLPPPTSDDVVEEAIPTPSPTVEIDQDQVLVAGMTLAATDLLASLDAAQRDKATYAFSDEERFRWHWTTPRNFPRNGLPLREMTEDQRGHAFDLLEASVSGMGFEKSLNIISLQNNLGNDPELYYVTIFGTPGTAEPWGWRWEGHHLSRQFTVIGERVAMLPFFLGSWPTTTEAGLRAMAQEEDAALDLINSLSGSAREMAIFQDRPLTRHVTQNAARVSPLEPVGILCSDLDGSQQQLVSEIFQAYLGTLPDHMAASTYGRVMEAGLEQIHFGWAGSLERQRPQYFRFQGPKFLLEYDNTRNGGTHIHSVWRDFEHDFGYHLL